MTTDQIFFTLLFVIGIPLGLRMFSYAEERSYKKWKKREKYYKRNGY
jgi:hypothetical protein